MPLPPLPTTKLAFYYIQNTIQNLPPPMSLYYFIWAWLPLQFQLFPFCLLLTQLQLHRSACCQQHTKLVPARIFAFLYPLHGNLLPEPYPLSSHSQLTSCRLTQMLPLKRSLLSPTSQETPLQPPLPTLSLSIFFPC